MMQYIAELTSGEKFYFYIALAGTTFFILQSFFTFLGFGDHFDVDADLDGEVDFDTSFIPGLNMSLHLFSMRGIIAFIMIFGWSGLAYSRSGMSPLPTFGLAFLSGFIMMFLISLIYYSAMKLGESGNVNKSDAIGKECEVYYPIPANRGGIGKVHIVLNDSLREVEAITEGDSLKSGELVKVVNIIDDKLVVEKIS